MTSQNPRRKINPPPFKAADATATATGARPGEPGAQTTTTSGLIHCLQQQRAGTPCDTIDLKITSNTRIINEFNILNIQRRRARSGNQKRAIIHVKDVMN